VTKVYSRFGAAGSVAALLAGAMLGLPAAAEATTIPAIGLPFAAGQQVYSAGIHADNGDSGVKNAIDFTPTDKTVRAPLGGIAHLQHCAGGDWVTIDHEGGLRTGYYHMEGIAVTDGQQVETGTVLGSVGNALPCGGSTTGAHVHFTLWILPAATASARGDSPRASGNWSGVSYAQLSSSFADAFGESVSGKTIGGWLFTEGTEQYKGTATRVRDGRVTKLPGRFRYEG
jgi:LasA protease